MAEFFQAQAELDVQMTEEALRRYENLCSAGFSKSSYVKQQMALAYYNLRGKDIKFTFLNRNKLLE